MCATDIGVCKGEGVAKAQVNVRLGCKVQNGVNIVLSQAAKDRLFVCYVSKNELKVGTSIETFGVIERGAVIDFVEDDNLIVFRICESQMADDPGSSVAC